jgi:UDP-2,3-diacylglucosamine hydrolase
MGNHDFSHNNFFADEFGINIITNDTTREFSSQKFYLSHGDGKSKSDKRYFIIKKILRNKICQKMYSLLHPDIGIGLAAWSSRRSKKMKNKEIFEDDMYNFAKNKILEGYDYVITGHKHLAGDTTITRTDGTTGRYINIGG